MLKDSLDKILNPKTLKEVFANNEQGILYERLTASLKEAVMSIKSQMMEDMKKMSDKMAQDIVSKIKDSPVYNKLIASMEEAAMGMNDKIKVETEPIILRNVQQAISKIKIPKVPKVPLVANPEHLELTGTFES